MLGALSVELYYVTMHAEWGTIRVRAAPSTKMDLDVGVAGSTKLK